jgi:thymidylate synthase
MESQYIELLQHIVCNGKERITRNGNVKSIFGATLECDLVDGFPLLTTKKMFWRGIVEELSWFLRGSTNVQELRDKKVHIWDGNSETRNYDAGPVYGFQWRHFGAEYTDCHADYTGKGHDQIASVLHLLKSNPQSRRMVLSAWCPAQQEQMCLPPCHVMYQFYVEHDERVSCMMTQRSADVFLGLPFNIASTALLTHLIANQVGRKPGRLIIQVGDAHVYEEHYNACQQQIAKKIMEMPTIQVLRKSENLHFNVEDVVLMNYKSHGRLKAPMKA